MMNKSPCDLRLEILDVVASGAKQSRFSLNVGDCRVGTPALSLVEGSDVPPRNDRCTLRSAFLKSLVPRHTFLTSVFSLQSSVYGGIHGSY